jgi:hypothetical protein
MISETKRSVLEKFGEGRKLYKLMDFVKAGDCFRAALALDPEDGPSKEYLTRCDYYIKNPPPEDWDGVYTMKTK